jgi:hypothetical protein
MDFRISRADFQREASPKRTGILESGVNSEFWILDCQIVGGLVPSVVPPSYRNLFGYLSVRFICGSQPARWTINQTISYITRKTD